MFARGIEGQLNISDYIESLEGTKKTNRLKPLSPYLEKLEHPRDEILTETFTKKSSLHNTPEDTLYYPCTGDLVLCLTGSLKTSEMGTVTQGVEDVLNDAAHTDPIDQNQKISQRKVFIQTKTGGSKLYPVQSLCLLAEARNSLEWDKSRPEKLNDIPGKSPLKLLISPLGSYFTSFSAATKEAKIIKRIRPDNQKFISSTFYFFANKNSNTLVCICYKSNVCVICFMHQQSQLSATLKPSISKIFRSRQSLKIHDYKLSVLLLCMSQHEYSLDPLSGNYQSRPVLTSDQIFLVLTIFTLAEMKFPMIAALLGLSYAAPVPDPGPFQLVSFKEEPIPIFIVDKHPEKKTQVCPCPFNIYITGA